MSPPMCGGTSESKPVTSEIQSIADQLKSHVATKVSSEKQSKLEPFRVVSYKTQVVAGLNYFLKVAIDGGNEFVHLRVHKPLGDNPTPVLASHQEGHSADSELTYF